MVLAPLSGTAAAAGVVKLATPALIAAAAILVVELDRVAVVLARLTGTAAAAGVV